MKVQTFSIKNKGEIFEHADSMHDYSFVAVYENNMLSLTFDHLDQYFDSPTEIEYIWE